MGHVAPRVAPTGGGADGLWWSGAICAATAEKECCRPFDALAALAVTEAFSLFRWELLRPMRSIFRVMKRSSSCPRARVWAPILELVRWTARRCTSGLHYCVIFFELASSGLVKLLGEGEPVVMRATLCVVGIEGPSMRV